MSKQVIHTDRLMRPIAHFSHAARIGDVVHIGATAGVHPDLRLAGECPGRIDTAAQIRKMFENLDIALGLMGAKASDVVRIKTYLAYPRDVDLYRLLFAQRFSAVHPAHAVVGSWDFPLPQAAVELDAVAVIGGGMADGFGGITAGGFQYATASPVDEHGHTVAAGNTREQIAATLRNFQARLDAAELRRRDVCYIHLTLQDIRQHADVGPGLWEFFEGRLPACTVVGAPLERADFSLSIEFCAAKGGGEIVASPTARPRHGSWAPAVLSGDVLFLSGQTGLQEDGPRPCDVREQTERAWETLHGLIASAGFGEDTMLRTNNLLTDWRDYVGFNAGYGKNVREPYVPRATVLGHISGAPGARVQIEGIAHRRGAEASILQVRPSPKG